MHTCTLSNTRTPIHTLSHTRRHTRKQAGRKKASHALFRRPISFHRKTDKNFLLTLGSVFKPEQIFFISTDLLMSSNQLRSFLRHTKKVSSYLIRAPRFWHRNRSRLMGVGALSRTGSLQGGNQVMRKDNKSRWGKLTTPEKRGEGGGNNKTSGEGSEVKSGN